MQKAFLLTCKSMETWADASGRHKSCVQMYNLFPNFQPTSNQQERVYNIAKHQRLFFFRQICRDINWFIPANNHINAMYVRNLFRSNLMSWNIKWLIQVIEVKDPYIVLFKWFLKRFLIFHKQRKKNFSAKYVWKISHNLPICNDIKVFTTVSVRSHVTFVTKATRNWYNIDVLPIPNFLLFNR